MSDAKLPPLTLPESTALYEERMKRAHSARSARVEAERQRENALWDAYLKTGDRCPPY